MKTIFDAKPPSLFSVRFFCIIDLEPTRMDVIYRRWAYEVLTIPTSYWQVMTHVILSKTLLSTHTSHVTSFIFNKNYLSRTRLVDFCLLICLDGSLWDHFLSFWFDRWKNSRIFFTCYLGAMFANTNEFWRFYWCKKWHAISEVTQITKGQSTWKKKHLKKEMENWVSVKSYLW